MTTSETVPSAPQPGDTSLLKYAQNELDLIGYTEDAPDDFERSMRRCLLEAIEAFSRAGHSGMSAAIATQMLESLLRYEPLSEITYGPEQWMDQSGPVGHQCWQHKRKFSVFTDDGGKTWYDTDDPKTRRTGERVYHPVEM